MIKQKKAAMEMAVGTIVTVVLLVSVLVLGLYFIKQIHNSVTGLVESLDEQVYLEIEKIFEDTDSLLVIYPRTYTIPIQKGTSNGGFAIAINNINKEEATFNWSVFVDPDFDIENKCKISYEEAQSWLLQEKGTIFLQRSSSNARDPEKILFIVPKNAPRCTINYAVEIFYLNERYDLKRVNVEIK